MKIINLFLILFLISSCILINDLNAASAKALKKAGTAMLISGLLLSTAGISCFAASIAIVSINYGPAYALAFIIGSAWEATGGEVSWGNIFIIPRLFYGLGVAFFTVGSILWIVSIPLLVIAKRKLSKLSHYNYHKTENNVYYNTLYSIKKNVDYLKIDYQFVF